MSKRATLVLAVLVALLGGYIVLFERDSLTSKELDERKGRVLPTFVRDKVTRLSLTRRGQRAVLERAPLKEGESSSWKMLEPSRVDADQQTVDGVLGELEWLSARRVLQNVSEQDRKAFGLASPSLRVTYRVAGADHTLLIGKTDVHGESYYAAHDADADVYVVPKTLIEALDHEPSHFRSKQFLGSIVSAWAQRIELRGPQGALSLLKENGSWWLLGEPKSYADPKRAAELVDKLDALRAVRYLDGEAKQQGLQALAGARRTVELRVVPEEHREDKQPERFELQFAGACPGHPGERVVRAGERGDPLCVAASELTPFEASAQELRLGRPLSVDPSEIESLELGAGEHALVLKREGENWTSQGEKLDRGAVEAWLAELAAQQASGVLPVRDIAADERLTLQLADERKLQLTADVDEAEGRVLLRRTDEPALVIFPRALADLLAPFKGRFASLDVWAAKQPSQVTGIDVRAGALARKLTNEQGAWRKQAGAPPLKEDARVRELVRALIKLHLLAVLAERARPEHGLTPPAAKLSFALAGGAPPLSLELGAQTPRGAFARVDGGPVALVGPEVPRALLELAGGTPPPLQQPEAGVVDEHMLLDEDDEHDHEHE